MRLTPTQVESFYQDGYLVVEGALSDEDLNPLISDFEALITLLSLMNSARKEKSRNVMRSYPSSGVSLG